MSFEKRKSERLLSAMNRIDDELVLSAAQENKVRSVRPRWVAAVAAAVLVLTLAVGAGAAGGHIPVLGDLFAPAFYGYEEDAGPDDELLGTIGQPVGVSVERQGVTVTVQSILRDRYTLTAVLSVHKKGIEHESALFDWNRLIINDSRVLEGGSGALKYGVRGDDAMDYVITWQEQEPIPDGKMELVLENLTVKPYAMFGMLPERHIDDTWSVAFEAHTEDLSRELPAGQHVAMDETDAVLDEIILSPLSLTVKYTAAKEWDSTGGPEHPDFTITLQNGEQWFNNSWYREEKLKEDGSVDYGSIYGSTSDFKRVGDSYEHFYTVHFSRLIPLEDVASVVIEGQEIPLR